MQDQLSYFCDFQTLVQKMKESACVAELMRMYQALCRG